MSTGPPQLAEWLRAPDDTLRRLEIRYVRRRSFRWLVLLELAIGLVVLVSFFVVLVVVALLALLLSGGDVNVEFLQLPSLSARFFTYRQDLVIQGIDAEGATLFEVVHQPASLAERDSLVASVLEAASRATLVVHESLHDDLPEPLESWYGGQPLLAHPEQRDLQDSLAVLAQWDWSVERLEPGLRLRRTSPATSQVWGGVQLFTSVLLLPLTLLGLTGATSSVRHAWANLLGVPPACWEVTVTSSAIAVEWQRGQRVAHRVEMHASDVLGVAYSPTLAFDRDVKRQAARLTLVSGGELARSPIHLEPREGRALRDALLGAAIAAWEGVPTTMKRPSRCPYCGGLYVFNPASGCPSCGAWPTGAYVTA